MGIYLFAVVARCRTCGREPVRSVTTSLASPHTSLLRLHAHTHPRSTHARTHRAPYTARRHAPYERPHRCAAQRLRASSQAAAAEAAALGLKLGGQANVLERELEEAAAAVEEGNGLLARWCGERQVRFFLLLFLCFC